jgi:hypothetical protein
VFRKKFIPDPEVKKAPDHPDPQHWLGQCQGQKLVILGILSLDVPVCYFYFKFFNSSGTDIAWSGTGTGLGLYFIPVHREKLSYNLLLFFFFA